MSTEVEKTGESKQESPMLCSEGKKSHSKESAGSKKANSAGITLSPARVRSVMNQKQRGYRIGDNAPVALAAMTEFLLEILIEKSKEVAEASGKKVITPEIIRQAFELLRDFLSAFGTPCVIDGGHFGVGAVANLDRKRKKNAESDDASVESDDDSDGSPSSDNDTENSDQDSDNVTPRARKQKAEPKKTGARSTKSGGKTKKQARPPKEDDCEIDL